MSRQIHLICNAHLDPVWLWEWEEGAAEAISTFRIAAELCEQNDTFIFNHNEVTLYKWVLEYEPALFKRIQALVKAGRWHIMGGWYLQPDCNMPSGESFVRQILEGKAFFKQHFGVEPTTAINFDPFGHTQGLVQILAKSGYDSYLFGRPQKEFLELPHNGFVWVGFDGSEVIGQRFVGWYNTPLGKAKETIQKRIEEFATTDYTTILWGVGNHGGGPSRADLQDVNTLIAQTKDLEIRHSTPDQYFSKLSSLKSQLPRVERDLNPWAPGCYSSQIRIKQKHRQLENDFYMMEKMACEADLNGLMPYPSQELHEVICDLLNAEFHDILPGSAIQPAEEAAIRQMDHGLEILSRLRARAFFALASGQPKAADGQTPVFVYNPHPYDIQTSVECEFNLPDFDNSGAFSIFDLKDAAGTAISSQVEQELSSLAIDWRKRVVFDAKLKTGMNRFNCVARKLEKQPEPALKQKDGVIAFTTERLNFIINTQTGMVDKYAVDGIDYVKPGAFAPIVIEDNCDPWGMNVTSFRKVLGSFKLMDSDTAAAFCGFKDPLLPSVRVVEDGPVRSVVEVLFQYECSAICQRYKLPKSGTEIEVEVRVFWNQKDQMLKLSLPMTSAFTRHIGQVAYGTTSLPCDGTEAVAQKWVGVAAGSDDLLFTCINNGTYACDFSDQGLRLTLLRSPTYSGHPIGDKPIVKCDRYTPRMDQGERIFRFWFNAGPYNSRREAIDREALAKNEKPFALSFFPSGEGAQPSRLALLCDEAITITALKQSHDGKDIIVRLFEPTGQARSAVLKMPVIGLEHKITLSPYEIKTLRVNAKTKEVIETDLLERPLPKT
ncbi:MAG: alpha-mannosidase [Planctomycetes bacterium GWF2_50_10]|nr:MAG: alpha-mannosidase [Planctomycetes bacterium GWF2_50_10]